MKTTRQRRLIALMTALFLIFPVLTAYAEEEVAQQAPIETALFETEPVETEPVETEPVETEPVETEPAETEPVETEPVETEPVETEPVETEPVETEPVETEPVETEPVETEPVETEPVETEPVETEPVETELVETELVHGELKNIEEGHCDCEDHVTPFALGTGGQISILTYGSDADICPNHDGPYAYALAEDMPGRFEVVHKVYCMDNTCDRWGYVNHVKSTSWYNSTYHKTSCYKCGWYGLYNHTYLYIGGEIACSVCGYVKP